MSDNNETTTATETTETTETTATAESQPATTPASETEQPAQGDGQPGEGEKASEKANEPPAEYADFAMPEGVEYDAELGGELKAAAKAAGLSQEQAQTFADLGAKLSAKLAESVQSRQAAQVAEWENAARADKEFGGEGLAENLKDAKAAALKFGGEGLVKTLNETGLGNHPDLIRAFYRIAQITKNDGFVASGTGSKPVTNAQSMYPNSNMKP